MHLQQHPHIVQPGIAQRPRHPDHRALDDVRTRPLDRRVDRGAFGALPLHLHLRIDVGEPRLPPEQRRREAGFAHVRNRVRDVVADARKAFEIAVDHRLRLVRGDRQSPRQAPARNAVEDREIDRFRPSAGVAIDLAEQFLRGQAVNVVAVAERLFQRGNVRHMRRQPQFDLRIIGAQQHIARLGDERLADAAAILGADRDVLQIGVVRRQPPGLRPDQRITGVHPPRLGIDLLLQRVGIGRLELGQFAPVEHLACHLDALPRQPLQLRRIGRIRPRLALAPALQRHLVEQDFAQLLGAADGEFLPRQRVDFLLQNRHLPAEFARQPGQMIAVDLDPRALHHRQRLDQPAIDAFVHARHAFARQPRLQLAPQPQRHIGILGGVPRRIAQRHLVEAELPLPLAAHFGKRDRPVPQMPLGQFVHIVRERLPGIERETHHQRVVIRRDVQPVPREHRDVVFEIMPDLEHRWIGKQRPQFRQRRRLVDLRRDFAQQIAPAMRQRHVTRLARRDAQRKADQPRGARIQPVGFGIDRHRAQFGRARDPVIEPVEIGDAFIRVEVERRLRLGRVLGPGCRRATRHAAAGLPAQPRQQCPKPVMLEKFAQRRLGQPLQFEPVDVGQRLVRIAAQLDQLAAQPRHVGMIDQRLLQLGLGDPVGARQHRRQVTIFDDQLRRGLRPDPRHPRHIVHAIPHQREDIAQPLRPHAELFHDMLGAQPPVVHRVVQIDARFYELHQILVGTDDRHRPPAPPCFLGVTGDDVVGLEVVQLDARQRQRARRIAHHRELRAQILGRFGPVRLVFGVHVVAKRLGRRIEDHRHVRRPALAGKLGDQLPQHRRIAVHRAHRLAMLVGQRREAVIGAENVSGAVDKIEMRGSHSIRVYPLSTGAQPRRHSRSREGQLA
ncbi:hypothetical protein SPAN111604_13365 [Sphingomonas antarctica]